MELKETQQYQLFRKLYIKNLNQLNQDNHKIIISYFGVINEDFIHELIEGLERFLIERKIETNRIKNLYTIALQSLNNMNLYGERDCENQKLISFFVSIYNDRIHVITANLIQKDKQDFLTEYLTKINDMESTQLKDFYNKAIQNSFTSKDKNGIGLISMRYLSDERLQFYFKESSDLLIFSIQMC